MLQIQFMHNHHLLQLFGKPSWLTLRGGGCVNQPDRLHAFVLLYHLSFLILSLLEHHTYNSRRIHLVGHTSIRYSRHCLQPSCIFPRAYSRFSPALPPLLLMLSLLVQSRAAPSRSQRPREKALHSTTSFLRATLTPPWQYCERAEA